MFKEVTCPVQWVLAGRVLAFLTGSHSWSCHQFRLDGSGVNIIKTVYSACIDEPAFLPLMTYEGRQRSVLEQQRDQLVHSMSTIPSIDGGREVLTAMVNGTMLNMFELQRFIRCALQVVRSKDRNMHSLDIMLQTALVPMSQ